MCYITFIDLRMLNHPWVKPDLILANDVSDMSLDLACHYFIEDFALMLIKEIGL
jgi:hypothetical protein